MICYLKVVPVQQSVDMFKALRDRGVTAGLMLFEGTVELDYRLIGYGRIGLVID